MWAFIDAETEVIAHLTGRLTVPVVGEVPNPRPPAFVRVERVGGGKQTRVTDAVNLAVEAWAATDIDASILLNETRAHLFDLEGALFGVTEYAGPARLPDPDSHMSRYTASIRVLARARQISFA